MLVNIPYWAALVSRTDLVLVVTGHVDGCGVLSVDCGVLSVGCCVVGKVCYRQVDGDEDEDEDGEILAGEEASERILNTKHLAD